MLACRAMDATTSTKRPAPWPGVRSHKQEGQDRTWPPKGPMAQPHLLVVMPAPAGLGSTSDHERGGREAEAKLHSIHEGGICREHCPMASSSVRSHGPAWPRRPPTRPRDTPDPDPCAHRQLQQGYKHQEDVLIPLPHDAVNESSVRCGRAAVGTTALFAD